MKFYREATLEDIRFAKSDLEEYLPQEVKDLVHSNDLNERRKSAWMLNKMKCIGIQRSKDIIEEYCAILRAERDVIEGKIVYTEY